MKGKVSAWDQMLELFELVVIDWFGEFLARAVALGFLLAVVSMIPAFFLALFFLVF